MTEPDDARDPFDTDEADEGPTPLPETPLAELITIRPPWSWSNLTEDEARRLDTQIQEWVIDYNTHLALAVGHVIPGCWRQHPGLSQTLPIVYWAWWDAHRNPAATIRSAVEFHTRHLPAFQDRLDTLLVDKAAAGKCRSGRHQQAPDADRARLGAIALGDTADAAQRGPDVIAVLLGSEFGC
jgi:hypothetical protein